MFKFLLVSALLFFLGYGIFSFISDKFGGNKRRSNPNPNRRSSDSPKQESKKFSKDIGEYVNYEEVKDIDQK